MRRASAKFASAVWASATFLIAFFLGTPAALPDEHWADRVAVLERGIFHAISRSSPIAESTFGPVTEVRNVSLVLATTTIPARKSLRFGVRYIIEGAPAGAAVDLRLVTRFPEAGLLDPVSGLRHYQSEYTIRGAIGAPAYREFMFHELWEVVAGEWVFEFWSGGRNIGSQKFCVLDAESASRQAPLRSANCSFLIGTTWSPSSPIER